MKKRHNMKIYYFFFVFASLYTETPTCASIIVDSPIANKSENSIQAEKILKIEKTKLEAKTIFLWVVSIIEVSVIVFIGMQLKEFLDSLNKPPF